MIKVTPILLALAYGLVMYRLSVWRTKRELDAQSTELADPALKRMTDRLAAALEIDRVPVYIYEIDPVNGLAAPDGRIFITRGFYRKFLNGEVSTNRNEAWLRKKASLGIVFHVRFKNQSFMRVAQS